MGKGSGKETWEYAAVRKKRTREDWKKGKLEDWKIERLKD